MRLRSHSKGPWIVSSKSVTSNTRRRSGVAKVSMLWTWASPHSWVMSPVVGVVARSAAITAAEPRRKAKGEVAMRA